jgi:hypothetical protein
LHSFGDRLRVAEVVLLALAIRAHVFRWHQPCLVPKGLQLAAEMMRADAGLHADQALERVLADIDAAHGDCCVEFLRHGALLVLSAPCQLQSLAGLEHGSR